MAAKEKVAILDKTLTVDPPSGSSRGIMGDKMADLMGVLWPRHAWKLSQPADRADEI